MSLPLTFHPDVQDEIESKRVAMPTANDETPDAPESAKTRPTPLNPGVGWYAVLIVALYMFWIDAPSLADRTGYGSVRVFTARVGYGLIAVRALFAVVFRHRSWAWILYAVLLMAIGLLVVRLTQSP